MGNLWLFTPWPPWKRNEGTEVLLKNAGAFLSFLMTDRSIFNSFFLSKSPYICHSHNTHDGTI